MRKSKPKLSELEKIILEILLEKPDNQMKLDDLMYEAERRQQRIEQLGDMK